MGIVFVAVGMSLDGFIAGKNGGPSNPLGDGGATIHRWIYPTRAFRRNLVLGGGGETGPDNDYLEAITDRIGANIMGKQMFVEGEHNWPEHAPFHTPVFVMTHERRASWPRPGGTTFHFVDRSIHSVLEDARVAAGDKDVRIAGGATLIRQFLEAGLVDELSISLAPVVLGEGVRLFDGLSRKLELELFETIASPAVTHLRYRIVRRAHG